MKRLMTIILILFTFFIIVGVSFLFAKNYVASKEANTLNVVSAKGEKHVSYSPGDSFITNIKDSNKYVKVKVVLELQNEKSKKYFEKNDYKIKDLIIGVLRNKTEQDLFAQDSQEVLKESIRAALGSQLNLDNLINIYIEEFVIQ